jgi:hypothetical protein
MEENMGIKIGVGNQVIVCSINKDIEMEEMDDKGYFYINSSGKIVIMNSTSFWIWKYIIGRAEPSENVCINLEEIENSMLECFEFSVDDVKNLDYDIYNAIINFIREDFLLVEE